MKFEMTPGEFQTASDHYEGRCIECGAVAHGCEPDAHEYKCNNCGEKAVYGLEQLLLMGNVIIDTPTNVARHRRAKVPGWLS